MRDGKIHLQLLATCLTIAITGSACAPYRVHWGDVHTHTTFSDGKTSIDELLTCARDVAHLDFVIVTDHDFGDAPPWRLSRETWQRIQDAADRYTVEGRFVVIAGYEWTSQAKYWSGYFGPEQSEGLFPGEPRYFNHKNVYFAARVPDIFRSKDVAYSTPDQLAAAVLAAGGLVQNNHPGAGPEGRDQWDYEPRYARVIANTEMMADVVRHAGREYQVRVEQTIRDFLNGGGRTGFVGGSDTHEGRAGARTGVWTRELSRSAILAALRCRRNYATSGARIALDFRVNGHRMGEQVEVADRPRLQIHVQGTASIAEILVIRDGAEVKRITPDSDQADLEYADDSFAGDGYYYIRVTQANVDEHGNPWRAWSSPIWVKRLHGQRVTD